MTKTITSKNGLGTLLLLVCLIGSSRINQSHASILGNGMGGSTDTLPPVISINGKDTVYVEVFGTYIEDGAVAMDNKDGNLTTAIVLTGSVNTKVVGINILIFKVKDMAGNISTKQKVVIVGDSQKPIISNPDADANNRVKVQVVSAFIDRTKVTDNYDNPTLVATPGASGQVDSRFIGNYAIVYNATDGSGNKADTKTYNYIVDDFIPPTISLNTANEITWIINTPFNPVQPTVTDNYYNSSQITLTQTSNVNPNKLGLYFEEFTATDGSGNVTVRRRYVRIVEGSSGIANANKNAEINLYPNPSRGIVNIENYFSSDSEIMVYNSRGELLSTNYDCRTLDLSKEANGLYVVRIKTDGETITRLISIQK